MIPRILWISAFPPRTRSNWTIDTTADASQAVELVGSAAFDAVVIETPVPEWTPEDLLEEIKRAQDGVPVVIYDAAARTCDAVRYMRLGAHDVATTDPTALVDAAVDYHGAQDIADPREEPWRKFLVGTSRAMRRTADIIRLVAGRRSTVLITGETGTGKEVVARAIHMAGPRATMPFVAVNCNALPETLLEAELFGHVKGAFTGAVHQRMGRFEQAHRGTLFLDEIGDLPLDIQAKLLRVLQEREFQRVGSSETVRFDVRLVAATNVDLVQKIREGKFREDLYYRLNVVPIATTPLRERAEDVPALAHHFNAKVCRQEDIPLRHFPPETLARLASYHWPGNVRQLENEVEKAITLSGDREYLYPSDFPLHSTVPRMPPGRASIALPETGLDFEQTVGTIERQILEQALRKAGGNKTAAAGMLGLKRTTLSAKLKSLEAGAGQG